MKINEMLDLGILIFFGLVFIAIIISAMIYNPNYSIKEILKKPWLIFDLIRHSADTIEEHLDAVQNAIEEAKEIREDVKELVEKTKEVIEDIKDFSDKDGD